jgi:tRNA/tmRNA/rRNA uracil-C5-methylase (TrmA/RlmC/RlmD family)
MGVGDRLVLNIESVAHGGHFIARIDGRVVFVRHAIPGERVEIVITGQGPKGRFLQADVIDVLEPAEDRVAPPCRYAAECGGCDFQHVSLVRQRRLKAEVLREQLERLGGLDEIAGRPLTEAVDVVAVPGDFQGLSWRTRVRYAVDDEGRVGLRRHHSHQVVPIDECVLATSALREIGVPSHRWPTSQDVVAVASSTGDRVVIPEPTHAGSPARSLPADVAIPGLRGRAWVREAAGGREWRVAADGFWQVHPGAPGALVDHVRERLDPRAGEHLLDLYSGVGLFAGLLAADLGPSGHVDAVEVSVQACSDARRNLHDVPIVRIHQAAVDRWLSANQDLAPDLVVLDPPRGGAGRRVVESVLRLNPRAVAYVACDPAALGRDLGYARGNGYEVESVQGFDLFPMTHHMEAIALLRPRR